MCWRGPVVDGSLVIDEHVRAEDTDVRRPRAQRHSASSSASAATHSSEQRAANDTSTGVS
ncbi:MAG: hypothetical protein EA388_02880 [Nitriliruptor sp.]|nr:MAG: hypothetical protein EA388_02880 [Nitriliruptor sp.]